MGFPARGIILLFLVPRLLLAAEETLNPDAVSTPDQWANHGGADKVTSVTDNVDTTYIYETASGQIQRFALSDPATIGSGDTIDSVKTVWRGQRSGLGASVRANQVLSTNKNTGTTQPLTSSWQDYSDNFTQKPGGGSWSLADLNNLEIETELVSILGIGSQGRATRVYVTVYYTPAETYSGKLPRGIARGIGR